jgi:hypothetical protein
MHQNLTGWLDGWMMDGYVLLDWFDWLLVAHSVRHWIYINGYQFTWLSEFHTAFYMLADFIDLVITRPCITAHTQVCNIRTRPFSDDLIHIGSVI